MRNGQLDRLDGLLSQAVLGAPRTKAKARDFSTATALRGASYDAPRFAVPSGAPSRASRVIQA